MTATTSIIFEPLGDQALLATLADEATAFRFATAVRAANPPWLIDVVFAYVTVAVFIDFRQIDFATAELVLRSLPLAEASAQGKLHVIPCCYEMGPDLHQVADALGLDGDMVIRLHTSVEYTVFAIGFCPGFPYLGYLPKGLSGVPRLPQPRVRVEPGSVGIAGRQTGFYPLPRPGGWNLIGRTPLEWVNVEEGYFPIRAGGRARFQRISAEEFRRLEGKRPD